MSNILKQRDVPLWNDAKNYLDVRNNDEHSLIAYELAKALLEEVDEAEESIVLPAILMHDMGWKHVDPDKVLEAIGPNPKYPELVRKHETEGVIIAREILQRHQPEGVDHEAVLVIIDRHDTWKHATSVNDAVVKDADKVWRFTPHGIRTIGNWFDMAALDALDMLEDFVVPQLLTDTGRHMAKVLIAAQRGDLQYSSYLKN